MNAWQSKANIAQKVSKKKEKEKDVWAHSLISSPAYVSINISIQRQEQPKGKGKGPVRSLHRLRRFSAAKLMRGK